MACSRTHRLSIDDRLALIAMYYGNKEKLSLTVKEFNDTHATSVSRTGARALVNKFKSTGSVHDGKRKGHPRTTTDECGVFNVLQCVHQNPQTSTRQIAQECNMSQYSVLKILKENNFRPFKEARLQELRANDPERRLEFCTWYLTQLDVWQTVFTDEAVFHVNGNVISSIRWAVENPRNFVGSKSLHSPKVLVWAGIVHGRIVGPYFFNGNVTGASYLQMLQENVVPAIRRIEAEIGTTVWLQHDGAPPHNALVVRSYLDSEFSCRRIGRGGPKEWPPRSPDLSPLDFFLWGYLKRTVYSRKPRTIEELKQSIVAKCESIPTATILKVEVNYLRRLLLCKQLNGKHVEHLL